MEELNNLIGMLELISRPAFCVKDGQVVRLNQTAQSYFIGIGTPVADLLATGAEEYADFSDGCLYLTLRLGYQTCGATVSNFAGFNVFVIDQDSDQAELQAMALAARELRQPLSTLLNTADRLFPAIDQQSGSTGEQVAQMNRGIYQMQRLILNMSDAARYIRENAVPRDVRDITAIFREVFRRAEDLICHTGTALHFTNLRTPLYCMVDEEKLERAIYNILSNALKFTPKDGAIEARAFRRNNKVYLTVQDNGSGVAENIRSSIYTRYLRQPSLEDGRLGIGLGMVMIRAAAAAHGGTVLMEHPADAGARITMTISIREGDGRQVRSPSFRVDYAGERDHALLELSDVLPWELYESDIAN